MHPIPGIKIAGKCDSYGKNPGKWWKTWAKEIALDRSSYMK